MAIDADLNAGLIGEDEGEKTPSESDSRKPTLRLNGRGKHKFVRGDAIARDPHHGH